KVRNAWIMPRNRLFLFIIINELWRTIFRGWQNLPAVQEKKNRRSLKRQPEYLYSDSTIPAFDSYQLFGDFLHGALAQDACGSRHPWRGRLLRLAEISSFRSSAWRGGDDADGARTRGRCQGRGA